ncbi:MAG TPA: ectoine/hydroxyectoine ABC transporter permease subunit EhuC [Nocardioides sp.]
MLSELQEAGPLLLEGAGLTLLYTMSGAAAALVLSFVLGLMALSRRLLVRGVARVVVELFRGTSLVVQLLWIFYVLPQLGIRLDTFAAATLALGLNFGAYGSEVVRGAINSVPRAQWEATVALSMSPATRMRRVILPQALPEMVPPFSNLWIQVLKSSSLLYLIQITELAFQVQELRYDVGSLTAFSIALVIYFVLSQVLVAVTRVVENRAAARVGRGPLAVRAAEVAA